MRGVVGTDIDTGPCIKLKRASSGGHLSVVMKKGGSCNPSLPMDQLLNLTLEKQEAVRKSLIAER